GRGPSGRAGGAPAGGGAPPAYHPGAGGWGGALGGGGENPPRPPANFDARRPAINRRALRAEPLVGVDHGLAVGAGLGEPLRGEALADLLQARFQRVARRQYFDPLDSELLAVHLVFICLCPIA